MPARTRVTTMPIRRRPVSRRRHRARLLPLAAVLLAAVPTVAPPASALTRHRRILFGVVYPSDSQSAAIADMGAPVALHAYATLAGSVPNAKMITMRALDTRWATLAAAGPGSGIYADLVRWAQTLRARPYTTLFAFHHEPEAKSGFDYGTSADFIAAFRHVEDVFDAQGVTNVKFVWQMTSWAFQVAQFNPGDPRVAAKWYPGDQYVDFVASDPYNFYTDPPGNGQWYDLSQLMVYPMQFAAAHSKKMIISEFGSTSDPRRAQWLANAHQWLVQNRLRIWAAFYFQRTDDGGVCCNLTRAAEFAAFDGIADDTTNFRSS